jgi:lipoic acid synthetase
VPVEAPLQFIGPRQPKPEWLKVRAPGSTNYVRLKGIMKDLKLNTVCEDARCPNIGECWHHGTATFMILGDVCTRACAYCAVAHGKPNELDLAEPARVAEAVARMALQYAVITSVDRDDLADGGAFIFAETIRHTRARVPGCRIEVLIPDFQGLESSLRTVLDATPDVLNHNTETVPRLYRKCARAGSMRARSNCSIDRDAIVLGSRRRPGSWSVSARSTTRSWRCSTICARPASRFSQSGSTSVRRPHTYRWRATTIPPNFAR